MAINSLYQAILNRIRRIPKAPTFPRPAVSRGQVIPFATGRIYKCMYTNYKHDPRPLVFIFSSDFFYTHGINVNYLIGLKDTMLRMILNMRNSGQSLTGMIMYQFFKAKAPSIPKTAYRKYFTKYLRGKLVSDGVSQIPFQTRTLFVADPFVRALNNIIKPKVINKVRMSQSEADRLKAEMGEAATKADQVIIGRK